MPFLRLRLGVKCKEFRVLIFSFLKTLITSLSIAASPIFAALIGWFFLKETVGPIRIVLIGFIALGAVLVEFGG